MIVFVRGIDVLSSAGQNFAAKLAAKFVGPCKIIRVYSLIIII